MIWFMVALILASIGFAAATIMKYKAFVEDVQPRVKQFEERGQKFDRGVEAETKLKDDAEKAYTSRKAAVDEGKRKIEDLKKSIKAANEKQEELEMALYKAEFRKAAE